MKFVKIFVIITASAVLFTACKENKNDTPVSSDTNAKSSTPATVAIFKGDLSYTGNVILAEEAPAIATMTKVGESYTITFANEQLPNDKRTITGIKFIEDVPGHFVSTTISGVSSTLVSGIEWTDNALDIGLTSTNPFFTLGYSGTKQ